MENKDNDIRPEGQDNYPIDSTREPKVNPTYKYVRPVHLLHLFAFLAIGLNLVGQCVFQNPFYKNMTAAVVIAPVGALTRWKLSTLNGSNYVRGFMSWLPWGTLLANILAAIISIICQGLSDRYGKVWNDGNPWLEPFFFAIKVGFAGSLSTVSTLVKEVANLQQSYPGSAKFVIYSIATLTGGMIFSLFVYMMIVRI